MSAAGSCSTRPLLREMADARVGREVCAFPLGQGTWRMGQRPNRRRAEIDFLRTGVELGMTIIDAAEMYGDDATSELIPPPIPG